MTDAQPQAKSESLTEQLQLEADPRRRAAILGFNYDVATTTVRRLRRTVASTGIVQLVAFVALALAVTPVTHGLFSFGDLFLGLGIGVAMCWAGLKLTITYGRFATTPTRNVVVNFANLATFPLLALPAVLSLQHSPGTLVGLAAGITLAISTTLAWPQIFVTLLDTNKPGLADLFIYARSTRDLGGLLSGRIRWMLVTVMSIGATRVLTVSLVFTNPVLVLVPIVLAWLSYAWFVRSGTATSGWIRLRDPLELLLLLVAAVYFN